MRCFLPCFRTSKRRNQLRSADATPTQNRVREGPVVQELIDCIAESKIKNEEQSNKSAEIKKEQDTASKEDEKKDGHEEEDDEVNRRSHQEESSESLFSLTICSRKQVSDAEAEVNSPIQLVCTRQHVCSLQEKESNTKHHIQKPNSISVEKEEESFANELIKNLDKNEGKKGKVNHPVPQYRYRDCPDEGYDDINLEESDLDATLVDDDDPHNEKREGEENDGVNPTSWVQEESSESLFSLSTDSRIRISSGEEAENEVNSLMPLPAHATNHITRKETKGRIQDASSVLNPIENLTQGRVGKATVHQSLKRDKENINMVEQEINIPISPEPSLKLSNRKSSQMLNDKKEEIGVDTSLSNWLVESETPPISTNGSSSVVDHAPKGRRGSPWSHEDRPILGALTIDEIRMFSISISPRKSRSRSPDDTPIIGTVGSYWSRAQQNMDLEFNKSGKDLKRSSTALQTRLERVFEASVTEV
ncbi:hypothetical protein Fmac_007109 [Flemingia macrophylla]|uniref:Uncharacterized protein n=1 Tax=Flemingia macrophylla TaxID=520843 RepID=A0ABD1NCJ5_9FABA